MYPLHCEPVFVNVLFHFMLGNLSEYFVKTVTGCQTAWIEMGRRVKRRLIPGVELIECVLGISLILCSYLRYVKVARTTESMFHKKIINMLTPCDKGPFEKCRNAIFSDFDANWRKISKFENPFFSKSNFHFCQLSIRYIIRFGSADFGFVI